MILHLAEDEKFIDHVIEMFEEAAPNKNVYFIELSKGQEQLTYIKSKCKNIIAASTESEAFENILRNLSTYDSIILHNFYNEYKQKVVEHAPANIYFHWMSWGADIYQYVPDLRKKLYFNEKTKSSKKGKNANGVIGDAINWLAPNLWYKYYLQPRGLADPNYYRKLVQKINSVSTVLPNEVRLIRKFFHKKIAYYPFKYITIEGSKLNDQSPICTQNNFMIGNSANTTSNHIDAFLKIKEFVNEKVYVPLSYGGEINRDIIISKGYEMFGKQFYPLVEFMPIQEYNTIIGQCGNVIMNHKRQQAIGNIIIALWYGARVFLNMENPAFSFLKSKGIIIFKMSEVRKYKNLMSFEELALKNRPILRSIYAHSQVLKETKELVKHLT